MLTIGNVVRIKKENRAGVINKIIPNVLDTSQPGVLEGITFDGKIFYVNVEELDFVATNVTEYIREYVK
jgi:nitrogen regulatory protein PII